MSLPHRSHGSIGSTGSGRSGRGPQPPTGTAAQLAVERRCFGICALAVLFNQSPRSELYWPFLLAGQPILLHGSTPKPDHHSSQTPATMAVMLYLSHGRPLSAFDHFRPPSYPPLLALALRSGFTPFQPHLSALCASLVCSACPFRVRFHLVSSPDCTFNPKSSCGKPTGPHSSLTQPLTSARKQKIPLRPPASF